MNQQAAQIGDLPEKQIPVYEFGTDKTQKIELDLYSQSGRIEGKYGKVLETKPIQIWHLITMLLSMAEENNLNAELSSIFVNQRDAHATLSDSDKDRGYTQKVAPINRWTFEKAISLIDIPNIGDDLANARLGLTLNKNGLSIAFGMNVYACTNFNVLGGTILRAYSHRGEPAIPWELIQHRLTKWMSNLTQLWTVQTEWMKKMQEHHIPADTPIIEEIFGDLYLRAIHNAYPKQTSPPEGMNYSDITPFDTNELSKFAQESLRNRKKDVNNVWDLYNWGTSIMKPNMADIGEITNNSNDWANYLVENFELDVPEYEVIE